MWISRGDVKKGLVPAFAHRSARGRAGPRVTPHRGAAPRGAALDESRQQPGRLHNAGSQTEPAPTRVRPPSVTARRKPGTACTLHSTPTHTTRRCHAEACATTMARSTRLPPLSQMSVRCPPKPPPACSCKMVATTSIFHASTSIALGPPPLLPATGKSGATTCSSRVALPDATYTAARTKLVSCAPPLAPLCIRSRSFRSR